MRADVRVCLVRRQFDGTERREWLPPEAAVASLLSGPDNGTIYASGHIEWGGVSDHWPMGMEMGLDKGAPKT